MKPDYKKLHTELKKTGFLTDVKTEATVNGFCIDRSFTFGMEPNGVHVTCSIKGYKRSKGKVDIPNVRVVEFYSDGSAWVAQPARLDEAIKAIKALIKQRKEANK